MAHESVIQEMLAYFTPNGKPRTEKFSESDLQQITILLSRPSSKWRNTWNQAPRVYCVLRLIGLELTMDRFIAEGIDSDIWFPFTTRSLPSCLGPGEKQRFLDFQHMVDTDVLYLEKNSKSEKQCKHVHFRYEEDTPFIQIGRLGRGGFGVVHKVQSKISYKFYARKQSPRNKLFLRSKEEVTAFKREREAMMKLSHHHVIEFIGSYSTPKYLCLLISPVADMSLEKFLEKEQASRMRNELLREFFGCLSRAFQYLHETNIRHRDVKPANILIYQDKVKVADFGLSLDWTGKHSTTTAGTSPGWSPRYRAPEMADDKPRNSLSDIWSLGCVFLEMVTVLKGETVEDLLQFIKTYSTEQSGDRVANYHENPEAIIAWTEKLRAKSDVDNEPIAWVNEMLRPDSKERPYAAKLVDDTCDQGKAIRWPYCGICCADGSDDEGDAESDTDPFLYDPSSKGTIANRASLVQGHGKIANTYNIKKKEDHSLHATFGHLDISGHGKDVDTVKTIRVWNSATGAAHYTLTGHSDSVIAVAFSPDGNLIASGSLDKTLKLWDSATGAVRYTLTGHTGLIQAISFSPDGNLIASASYDFTVRIWDCTTGAAHHTLIGHELEITAVAFSPDSNLIASASYDSTVRIWESITGATRYKLTDHSDPVYAVEFSPDGNLIASASFDKTLKLWDSATGAVRHTLTGHSGPVRTMVFSPDSNLIASASDDEAVRLWDSTTGATRFTLTGHYPVSAIAFSPDNILVASASADNTVRLWESTTGVIRHILRGHSFWVSAVAFSPDGKLLVSASRDKALRLWDTATGRQRYTLIGHSHSVSAVAFSPDGKLIVSTSKL